MDGNKKPLDCNANGMGEAGKTDFRAHGPATASPYARTQFSDAQPAAPAPLLEDQLLLAIERDETTGITVIRKMKGKEKLTLSEAELAWLRDALILAKEAAP